MKRLLFVCLGNICRSPAAEGVARHLAKTLKTPVFVDSAGTGGWHAGDPPHATMRKVALHSGFPIDDLQARQVQAQDFQNFDWIVAMDRQNLADLRDLQSQYGGKAELSLLLDHAEVGVKDVPDPYYGGEEGFHHSFSLIHQGVLGFFSKNQIR